MKKYEKINFFASLKSLKKGVGSISQSYGSGDPDPESRIPNTGTKYKLYNLHSFPVHGHVVYSAL